MTKPKEPKRLPPGSERPNWDDLRFFLTLANLGTLAGAARVLGVKVSAVHR